MQFKWSKITDTPLARAAIQRMLDNFCEYKLSYHNLHHIARMYEYLYETDEPYDECLDWAVLFHDIVYDDKPRKEYRSALMYSDMKAQYSGCNMNILDEGHVVFLIMLTENHLLEYPSNSAIIRADLSALRFPTEAKENFEKIIKESMSLYKISRVNAAKGSLEFMRSFLPTIERNKIIDSDNSKFWDDVIIGIKHTIVWAQECIDEHKQLEAEYNMLSVATTNLIADMKSALDNT